MNKTIYTVTGGCVLCGTCQSVCPADAVQLGADGAYHGGDQQDHREFVEDVLEGILEHGPLPASRKKRCDVVSPGRSSVNAGCPPHEEGPRLDGRGPRGPVARG